MQIKEKTNTKSEENSENDYQQKTRLKAIEHLEARAVYKTDEDQERRL